MRIMRIQYKTKTTTPAPMRGLRSDSGGERRYSSRALLCQCWVWYGW